MMTMQEFDPDEDCKHLNSETRNQLIDIKWNGRVQTALCGSVGV